MSIDRLHRLRGKRILYCFGDSHIHMYRHTVSQGHLRRTIIRCTCARGATAYGLANPGSRSNALHTFQKRLESIPRCDYVLFMLGEVDCGSLLWHLSLNRALPAEELLEESLAHYEEFLGSLIGLGFENLIVSTIPVPAVIDDPPKTDTIPVRPKVPASLQQRTALTLRYNARLRQCCNRMNLRILDFEADLLDESSGVVRDQLLRTDALDHHLAFLAVAPVLAANLRDLGFA